MHLDLLPILILSLRYFFSWNITHTDSQSTNNSISNIDRFSFCFPEVIPVN